MSRKQTSYKLSLKSQNILKQFILDEMFQEDKEDCDLIFITKQKQIKCHRILLCVQSEFARNLFAEKQEVAVISLPGFTSLVVEAFVKFIYTGEVLIESKFHTEFVQLCKQLQVKLPDITLTIAAMSETDEVESVESLQDQSESEEQFENIEDSQEKVKENEADENQEEQIISTELEEELYYEEIDLVKSESDETLATESPQATTKTIAEKEGPQISNKSQSKTEIDIDTKLKLAETEVLKGTMNKLQACKKFEIPKTTFYRWIKRKESAGISDESESKKRKIKK